MLGKKPLKTAEDEMRRPQTPRLLPLPKPSVGVFDEPSVLIKVNVEWWSHVSGMIDVLSALDAWTGDIDEKTSAIRQIASLLSTDWSEMFVQDIRINTEDYDQPTLEKRINGVWSMVANWPDLLDLIQDAYELASAAFEYGLAAMEQNTVQDGQIVILQNYDAYIDPQIVQAQIDIINAQGKADSAYGFAVYANERLDILEPQVADHETRITALESAAAAAAIWSEEFDFTTGQHGWFGTYSSGNGFIITPADKQISMSTPFIYDAKITYVEVTVKKASGTSFVSATIQWPNGFNSQYARLPQNVDDILTFWIQTNGITGNYAPDLEIDFSTSLQSYYVQSIRIWGRGVNPF